MRIQIIRDETGPDGTFGRLFIDGRPTCVTLEETWLNNQPRISCIPAGTYRVTAYSGTKYKNVWILHDVPGRSAILIHWGNTNDNTAGCILCGRNYGKFGKKKGITSSRATIEMLRSILPRDFQLEIINAFTITERKEK